MLEDCTWRVLKSQPQSIVQLNQVQPEWDVSGACAASRAVIPLLSTRWQDDRLHWQLELKMNPHRSLSLPSKERRHWGGCSARLSLTTYAAPPLPSPPAPILPAQAEPSITSPARPFPFTLYDFINDPTKGSVCLANNFFFFTGVTPRWSNTRRLWYAVLYNTSIYSPDIWGWYKPWCGKIHTQHNVKHWFIIIDFWYTVGQNNSNSMAPLQHESRATPLQNCLLFIVANR